MSRGIFVTGTDTGVGKTLVAAGITRWLRGQGIDAVPMKPVQTGAERRGNRLIAPDLELSLLASGLNPTQQEIELMSPFLYEPACSPHLAGRMARRYPDIDMIQDCANKLLERHEALVVEGAGGIMVPLNEQATTLDLMKQLAYPVVLVSRVGLGAINHALLSISVLKSAGLKLAGVVFNSTVPSKAEDRFIEEDNPDAIARFGKVPVLGNVGFMDIRGEGSDIWRSVENKMPGLHRLLPLLERIHG